MTQHVYAQIVDSADNSPAEVFAARWMLLPEAEDIVGMEPSNLDKNKKVLLDLHSKLTRSVGEIRAAAGLSQKQLAERFAIPVFTVRNWEARGRCSIYVRLMMAQLLGQFDPVTEMGVKWSESKA